MEQTVMLIINPISGTGTKRGLEELVSKRIGPLGFDIDVRFTTCRGDATRLAGEAVSRGYHSVFAAGGDGTINETARSLCDTGVALGIIPAGSGNGLARHLGIPVDIRLSVDILGRGNIIDIDYGTANNERFFCTFGVGFDAAVSHRFAAQRRRGKLTYFKSVIEELQTFKPDTYTIEVNGRTIAERAFLVTVCNASQYGNNAYIAPGADIADGLLDIMVVHAGTPIETIGLGADLMMGYIDRNTLMQGFRTTCATIIRNANEYAHIDGEPITMPGRIECVCHRHGLRVYAPERLPHFTPIVTPISSVIRDAAISVSHIFNH